MATKSGIYWVTWANAHAKNSNKVDDLEITFENGVKTFVKALTDAGATVDISTTKKVIKEHIFFTSLGKLHKVSVTHLRQKKIAVDIEWDHGDLTKSKAGALEMVNGFGLAVPPRSINPPSLTSNHINGKAVDMTIKWTGTIKVKKKDRSEVSVTYSPNVNTNIVLHSIGVSYGVKKLKTDAPHWSYNGR